MQKEPPPFVWAIPDERNILSWHYIIRGPPDSPYSGGEYHGLLLFPPDYPFKPPGIKMITPSGRFQPDKKICFSMSDFHPGTWNPAWSVATILTGLLSFMLSDEMTTGSVTSTIQEKRLMAARSHAWNIQQKRFRDHFPEFCTEVMKDLPSMGEKERGIPDAAAPVTTQSISTVPQSIVPLVPMAKQGPRAQGMLADNGTLGWAATWRDLIWNKWRWGVLIAIAVLVSRLSAT